MIHSNSNNSDRIQSGNDGDGHEAAGSGADQTRIQKSNKQVELDFCLFEKGPGAAKRFNDLIAKTLKLQE